MAKIIFLSTQFHPHIFSGIQFLFTYLHIHTWFCWYHYYLFWNKRARNENTLFETIASIIIVRGRVTRSVKNYRRTYPKFIPAIFSPSVHIRCNRKKIVILFFRLREKKYFLIFFSDLFPSWSDDKSVTENGMWSHPTGTCCMDGWDCHSFPFFLKLNPCSFLSRGADNIKKIWFFWKWCVKEKGNLVFFWQKL